MSKPNKKISGASLRNAFEEIIWPRRTLIGIGLMLIVANRLSGLALPILSKFIIDGANSGATDMMTLYLGIVAGAIAVQAATSYAVTMLLSVEAQNLIRPDGLDPTRLIDQAFAGGMDHHHFMVKPRVLNQLMQGIARGLTGLGDLPDAKVEIATGHRHREVEVLIIGAGSAGRSASARLHGAGIEHVLVDRADRQSLATEIDGASQGARRRRGQVQRSIDEACAAGHADREVAIDADRCEHDVENETLAAGVPLGRERRGRGDSQSGGNDGE